LANDPERLKGIFASVLARQATQIPPIWLMRQAGRYLPEYRELRSKAGSFLELCLSPESASEATLQPIRRYDFDAAILFADILLVPFALGQELSFMEGEGPRLRPLLVRRDLERMRTANIHARLAPVYETVARVRRALNPGKALIGFAGAPWTVATYMLAGGPSEDPATLRRRWYEETPLIDDLVETLTVSTIDYLSAQIEAGVDAVQLFDTWAGGLPEKALRALSVDPLSRIADAIKRKYPETPVILFPKGVGPMAEAYANLPSCDAITIDFSTPWTYAREKLSPHAVVQGGLDPLLVVKGGVEMESAARRLIATFEGVPYIFNLGHGLTPDTPPENVAHLVRIVRGAA
jgi:uroporphyrinogen decarboxylase